MILFVVACIFISISDWRVCQRGMPSQEESYSVCAISKLSKFTDGCDNVVLSCTTYTSTVVIKYVLQWFMSGEIALFGVVQKCSCTIAVPFICVFFNNRSSSG